MPQRLSWLLIAIVILTACRDQRPEVTESPPQIGSMSATLTAAPLLVWYSDGLLTEALTALAADFEAANPQVNITLTAQDPATFRAEIAAALDEGAGPDLIIGSAALLVALAQAGELAPLDQGLRELQVLVDREAFAAGVIGEQVFAFPLMTEVPLIYINRAKTPAVPDSFAAFAAAAAQDGAVIDANFLITGGWAQVENFTNPLNVAGEPILGAATFTTFLEGLETLRGTSNVSFSQDPTPFAQGQAAFFVGSSRHLPPLRAALGDNLAVQSLAPTAVGSGYVFTQVTFVMSGINATTPSLEAGAAFIRFLAQQQPKLSQISGYAPMLPSFTDDPLLRTAAEIADGGIVLPSRSPFWDDLLPRLNTAVAQVISGALPPQAAAQNAFPNE